jgi:hypothetical protein
MSELFNMFVDPSNHGDKHPKCKSYATYHPEYGYEFDCGYNTKLSCDECKYGAGRKNPEAKVNKLL